MTGEYKPFVNSFTSINEVKNPSIGIINADNTGGVQLVKGSHLSKEEPSQSDYIFRCANLTFVFLRTVRGRSDEYVTQSVIL